MLNTNVGIKSQYYTVLNCKSDMLKVMQTALGSAYFTNKNEMVPILSVMTRHKPELRAAMIIAVCNTALRSCFYNK